MIEADPDQRKYLEDYLRKYISLEENLMTDHNIIKHVKPLRKRKRQAHAFNEQPHPPTRKSKDLMGLA
eukprot:scaffold20654_cov92-Amphora_coffeaeformis.AAC.1